MVAGGLTENYHCNSTVLIQSQLASGLSVDLATSERELTVIIRYLKTQCHSNYLKCNPLLLVIDSNQSIKPLLFVATKTFQVVTVPESQESTLASLFHEPTSDFILKFITTAVNYFVSFSEGTRRLYGGDQVSFICLSLISRVTEHQLTY